MTDDAPAAIAILGGGPIGLEAALYARFLGYRTALYERGSLAENLRNWGHVRLFSPWRMNVTPLGLAAIRTHDPAWQPPADDALVTGREFAATYLARLAQTDLLAGVVHEQTEVVAVGRSGLLKTDWPGDPDRGDEPFRLLLRDAAGERMETADIVFDATGTYGHPNWLGASGVPAVGERAHRGTIEYGLPDVLGEARSHYADRRVLVVGSGFSAATTVVHLAQLAADHPQTRITWLSRHDDAARREVPLPRIPHDRLPQRDALAAAANGLAQQTAGPVTFWPGTVVEQIARDGATGEFAVQLSGRHAGPIVVDRIIAQVGYRPNRELYAELQIHECYATAGPMKLAAALLGTASGDCLDQRSHGPQTLVNPEPNFFILGAKSYGRSSQFLLTVGHEQIRDIFRHLSDCETLDLYAPERWIAAALPS